MSVAIQSPGALGKQAMVIGVLGLIAISMPFVLRSSDMQHAILACAFLVIFAIGLLTSPRGATIAMLTYLCCIGVGRRLLIPVLGYPPNDPLLLVVPATVLLYITNQLVMRRIPLNTRLLRTIFAFFLIMVLSIFNPLQGGIGVGLAGIIFVMVPLLWFYVGYETCNSRQMGWIFGVTIGIAVAAAAYGLKQDLIGFAPFEKMWLSIVKASYNQALETGDNRSFSIFTSAGEYTYFLACGIVICWALTLKKSVHYVWPMGFLVVALVISSVRSPLLSATAGCCVVWALSNRSDKAWKVRLVFAVATVVGLFAIGVNTFHDSDPNSRVGVRVRHQIAGIQDPFSEKSSGNSHVYLLVDGIAAGFRNPLGYGLGSTTLAAAKFSGNAVASEFDISDAFTGFGFIGGLVYLAIIGMTLVRWAKLWRLTGNPMMLCAGAVLFASIGHWLHGGHYGQSMLVWLCVGYIVRTEVPGLSEAPVPAQPAVPIAVRPRRIKT